LTFAGSLRIGVLGLFHPAELTIRPTPQSVLVIEANGRRMILENGRQARLRVAGQQVECLVGDDTLAASWLRAESRQGGPAEFILSVPGRITRAYRGAFAVSARNGRLIPVVTMDLEAAVASAVEAESPPGSTLEALKAQAIVTRSYYLAARRHNGFDFCDTTHCQFIRGPAPVESLARAAAESTRGLVMTYRGKSFPALFSASCGGRTHSLAEVGLSGRGYPYYSVACEYCLRNAPRWRRVLNLDDAESLLSGPPTEAARLRIDRRLGWSAIPGNYYELEMASGSVVIQGNGQGHGIGLCQMGAAGMAAQGRSYRGILNYYFPNTSLGDADDLTPSLSPLP
jgi:stage II sporulation protein D (peptidoglycan lytic transglycosylase)